jgi:hypothetical protein
MVFSYPAVYGWKFSGGSSTDIIVLNLSEKNISIETSKITAGGSRYHALYADAKTYIAKGTEYKTEDGAVEKTLSLKPYSVTRISTK